MKIKIPKKIANQAGLDKNSKVVIELTELAERSPSEVTGSKFTNGVLIYVEEKIK